jgi:hypothetical protein
VAIRSRFAGFLACALILGAPAGFLASGAGELRARVDAIWKPQPIEFDRRWIALAELVALCGAGGAALILARQGRWRAALERELASAADHVACGDAEHAQLAERWDAWIESRYPLAFRGDTAGAALALEDRGGSAELDAAQWIGGSF